MKERSLAQWKNHYLEGQLILHERHLLAHKVHNCLGPLKEERVSRKKDS